MRGLKLSLILCLFIPSIVLGQGGGAYRNDNAFDGTGYVVGNGNHSNSVLAVDSNGRLGVRVTDPSSGLTQSVVPVSGAVDFNQTVVGNSTTFNVGTDTIEAASTATLLNLTAHGLRVGDIVIPTGGTAGNIGLEIPICQIMSANQVRLCKALAATPSTDAILIRRNSFFFMPKEDSGHTSGDAGVAPLFVNNRNMLQYNTTDKDYTPPSVTDYGSVFSYLIYDDTLGETRGAVSREDVAFPDAGALVKVGAQAVSAIAQTVGTTGDVAPPSMDLGNRLVTTKAPKGEMAEGCNTAVTTNTTGQIFAGVASKFSFVTSWECTNSGAAASFVILEDADGTDLARGYLAANTGYFSAPFPDIPAFSNAVNKAIQVNVLTTGTSTICCARGYYGVL